MRVEGWLGVGDLARVYLVSVREGPGTPVECVGALDPALPRSRKMVLVVSSQMGCPVGCLMCDAGRGFHGNLTAGEIHAQIDFLLDAWAGPGARACPKLKVQFARMGEPSLNPAVIDVIEDLPARHGIPGLLPCIATTAPRCAAGWFERLADVKDEHFGGGRFQLQLSVQSTSEEERRRMIPFDILPLEELSSLCRSFVRPGDRKVTLNFAMAEGARLDPAVLRDTFDPSLCLVKLTPLNPTARAGESGYSTAFAADGEGRPRDLACSLEEAGFEVLVSVGIPAESEAGSSCGQLAFGTSGLRAGEAPVRTAGAAAPTG